MSAELIVSIALFSFVTSVTPGPNNTILLSLGVNYGVRKSLNFINGIMLGFGLMLTAIGLGLGALFAANPVILQVLKYGGFAYILYLAFVIVRSTTKSSEARAEYIGFFRAASLQFLNPKAVIVGTTFMASYAPVESGAGMVALACVLFLATTYPGALIWAMFGSGLKGWLSIPSRRRIFNWVAAVLLVLAMLPVVFLG